jgi:hypothetical protein
MMRKDFQEVERSKFKKSLKNDEKTIQEVKVQKSEKMMRKDVSGG